MKKIGDKEILKKGITDKISLMSFFLCFQLFIACNSFNTERIIKGEIFIVTQSGRSNPLGLVDIAVIEKDMIKEIFAETLGTYLENEKILKDKVLKRENQIKSLKDLEKDLWEQIVEIGKKKTVGSFIGRRLNPNAYYPIDRIGAEITVESIREFIAMGYRQRTGRLRNNPDKFIYEYGSVSWDMPILKDYYSNIREIEAQEKLLKQDNLLLEEFRKGESLLIPISSKHTTVKSSSQGVFELKLRNRKEYYIIAVASRNLGFTKEVYLWFESINVENDNDNFYLSNDNIVSVNDILYYIK